MELLQGAIDVLHRTSTDPHAYNAELFNCYIAPWSPMFETQTEGNNATAIQITLEQRDDGGNAIEGTKRTYTITLTNPDSDPVAATAPLWDNYEYLPEGTVTKYTVTRNYLYQIDAVFMGPAGLQWNIKAIPQDWIDDGEVDLDMNL